MFRIRFHGRGGQGMKTASRILGTAFFLEGFEVQDAQRYGAERRGAPIFAYVRAATKPIHERGVITRPDLVIVADESLVAVPAADVLQGIGDATVVLINSGETPAVWKDRLGLRCQILTLPVSAAIEQRAQLPFVGAACAGAAARLTGAIARDRLAAAIDEEIRPFGEAALRRSLDTSLATYDAMAQHEGLVRPGADDAATDSQRPDWVDVPLDAVEIAAPDIHGAATSEQVNTGVWRTQRPVIDYTRCNRCSWVCSTLCPDAAIDVDSDRTPRIDYDHCKGCMVCVAVCPPHAIHAEPERGSAGSAS
jgi:pyruvate ferredoxin oxidoreductase gamma subunit